MFLFCSILISISVLLYFSFLVFRANFYQTYATTIGIVLSVVVTIFVFIGISAIKEENSVVYKNKSPDLNQYFWACDKTMVNPMADIIEVKQYRDGTWVILHSMSRQLESERCSEIEMVKR